MHVRCSFVVVLKGFLLGLLVAAAAVGGYHFWTKHQASLGSAAPQAIDAGVASPTRARKPKRSARALRAGEAVLQAPPAANSVKLSPADLRIVAAGDDLSKPDVLTLDMADQGSHELSQDDIDARFLPRQSAVIDCINRAQPSEDETVVSGKVTLKFRIQRTGTVRGIRIEAPAVLHAHGLLSCSRRALEGLRFPPSNGSQVVSYDFSLG